MTKVMTLNGSRGSYDVHTPEKARKYLFPSAQEEREILHQRLTEKNKRRKVLKDLIRKDFPKKTLPDSVIKEYDELGDEIFKITHRLRDLKIIVQQQTDETFESQFVRAAKNLLPDDQFQRIKDYAQVLMKELSETVYYNQD